MVGNKDAGTVVPASFYFYSFISRLSRLSSSADTSLFAGGVS